MDSHWDSHAVQPLPASNCILNFLGLLSRGSRAAWILWATACIVASGCLSASAHTGRTPLLHLPPTTAFFSEQGLRRVMAAAEAPVTTTFGQLYDLLRPLLQQALQGCSDETSPQAAEQLTEQLLGGLHDHLAPYIQGSLSIQAKGVPLPEVDEQLLPLQQQVEAVMQTVAGHRASVPAVISKALEQQLQEMRPDACAAGDDAEAPADQATAAAPADGAAEVAQAQQLQEALRAALNKLPALRARLEEMDVRLQRNLGAVDAAQVTAGQAPRTVERVLRSVAAGGKGRRAAAPDN